MVSWPNLHIRNRNLNIEQIKLDWISCVDILIREKVLSSQEQSFIHIDGLFTKRFVVIQPIHCKKKGDILALLLKQVE